MSKKILAMLMAVAMAFSLLPVTAFATDGPSATTTKDVVDGYYNDHNQWVKGEQTRSDKLQNTVTTVNKTAKKVDGQDNQYEVTLKVEMKHKTTEVQPGAAATVLVIDKSGSMNDNNRLPAAKTAAINFLKSYSGFSDSDFKENGSLKNNVSGKNLKRYVSLVTFNDSASLQTWGKRNDKKSWIDVSTKDGYNKLLSAINEIKATRGTNLDAALRLAKSQMQSDSIKQIEPSKKNVIALTDGVPTYYVGEGQYTDVTWNVKQHGSYGCPTTNQATATSATALKAKVSAVYTVCFGAKNQKCWEKNSDCGFSEHENDGPTVGDFLRDSIATQPTNGSNKQYAYNADNAEGLYQVFAAITQTITEGLNEGVVTDGLPTGVTAVEDSGFVERWELKSNEATVTQDGEYNVYTYTKTYKVNVDPATVKTVEVGEVNYAPLNTPTILTVQHNGSPVQIPFPIPAGKVTYSLTSFNKELVTQNNKPTFNTVDFIIPDTKDSTVTVGENGVTLLYKITVSGDKGAKFTVTDDGATLVSPTDSSITFNKEGSTFSGAVGTTGTTVFYVSKQFTKSDISRDTKIVSNTATIAPGDNAKGPDNDTATETTPAKEPDSQTYTVTYQWADENRPSDATLPTGNPFILNVGQKHTVQPVPTSDVKENNGKAGTWICTWDATSNEIQGNAGEDITIKGTWTFTEDQPTTKWDVSKSKKATNLDSNYESKVTLSIPSAETTASADIVIVMDVSSSMYPADITEAKSAVSQLCDRLNEKKNAKIKVGIVTFDKEAHELTNGLVSVEEAKEKVESITRSSDTNMMAGLIAGKKMLDEGTSSDKYMVIMSDGIPTYWVENGATISKTLEHYANNQLTKTEPAGTEPEGSWEWSDADKIVPMETLMSRTDWDSDSNIWKQDDNTGESLNPEYKYTNIQKAAYKTARYLEDEIIGKYKVKMVAYGTDKHKTSIVYKYGENFCDWIGQQGGVSYYKVPKVSYGGEAGDLKDAFDSISDEIIYLVDNGSYVTDYMGYVADDYNFDFINDVSKLSITVGTEENQETLKAEKIAKNHYGFGRIEKEKEPEAVQEMTTSEISYRYELEYVPGENNGDEHFIWRINVPVSNFAPVALTYSVKLVNPKSASGTYGQYDEDGSKNYSGLYTNNSATLYPVDSKGQSGVPENFLKPTVSYTVKGSSSGSHSGGSRPSLNTKDHYGYIIGYPVDYYTGQPTTDQTKKPVRPEGKITRAEVATIYFRMLTDESRAKFWSQSNSYSDVKAGDWFNNAVSTLSNAGIIAGYEDGRFRPNGYITRAEFATIAARFFDVTYNGKDLFPDISGHWAKDYINQAANKGFVNGYEDGTFKPDRNITRAEAVTLVNRTLDRHPDKNHFTKDMLVWPDNMDQTKWYYADMQEATNSHTYQMKENSDKTKYENWTKTLPIRNWEALEKAWSNANSSQGNGNVV